MGISFRANVNTSVNVTTISNASAITITPADNKNFCFIHFKTKNNPTHIKIMRIGYFEIIENSLSATLKFIIDIYSIIYLT